MLTPTWSTCVENSVATVTFGTPDREIQNVIHVSFHNLHGQNMRKTKVTKQMLTKLMDTFEDCITLNGLCIYFMGMTVRSKESLEIRITESEDKSKYTLTGLGLVRKSSNANYYVKIKIKTTTKKFRNDCPEHWKCLGGNNAPPATTPCTSDPKQQIRCWFVMTAPIATRYSPHKEPNRQYSNTHGIRSNTHGIRTMDSWNNYIKTIDVWKKNTGDIRITKDVFKLILKSLKAVT